MISFLTLRSQFLEEVRRRIRNGQWTERRLAVTIGISQPHLHHILRELRTATPKISDALLEALNFSLLDCLPAPEIRKFLEKSERSRASVRMEVPLLCGELGPGGIWNEQVEAEGLTLRLPLSSITSHMAAVVCRADPALPEWLGDANLAVLDLSKAARTQLQPENLYAVTIGLFTVLRRIRPGHCLVYGVDEASRLNPEHWQEIRHSQGHRADVVRGCVRWLGTAPDRGGAINPSGPAWRPPGSSQGLVRRSSAS